MKNSIFTKNKRLHFAALLTCIIAPIAAINARWVSLRNNTDSPVDVKWKNKRTNASSSMKPGAMGLIEIKPDKLAGSHYAVRDDTIYIKVDGKPISPFDAQKINEYIKGLWDNDAKDDPVKFAISVKTDDMDVPNVKISSFFDKAKEWFSDHKTEIGITAAAAAAAATGTYYASQDKVSDTSKPTQALTKDALIAKNLAVLGLDASERDPKVITKAYRKLALKLHPDKGGNKEAFQEINEAHEQLGRLLNF